MNYQLLLSHEKQKYSHNLNHRYNYSSLSRYTEQNPHHIPIESQFSFQSPMPIKLIHYKSRTKPHQSYSDAKPHKIRYKIKHKKVHLPSIDTREQKIKVISRSFQPSTHKLLKRRVKTQNIYHEDSEQSNAKMSQFNDRLQRHTQSRVQKHTPRNRQQEQKMKEEKKDQNRYYHRSKQREFEEYINQIQNKYRCSQSRSSLLQQAQIQQKLKHRIQTKKYLYCKPLNPEINSHQNQIHHSSLSYSRLSKNTIKQQVEQESEINEEKNRNQKEENQQRQRKRNAINDDFIKILRKAKNRGASLLIKLKKYPSKKLEAT